VVLIVHVDVGGLERLGRHVGWEPHPKEGLALSGFALLVALGLFSVTRSVTTLPLVVPALLGTLLALGGGFGGVRGWPPARWLQLVGLGAINVGTAAIGTLAVGVISGSVFIFLYLAVPALVGVAVVARGLWLVAAARVAAR